MITRDYYCVANFADRTDRHGKVAIGVWRDNIPPTGAIRDYQPAGPNNHSRRAAEIRDKFAEYFVNEGAVPWQSEVQ